MWNIDELLNKLDIDFTRCMTCWCTTRMRR